MMKKVDLKFDDISTKLDASVVYETPVPPVEPVASAVPVNLTVSS